MDRGRESLASGEEEGFFFNATQESATAGILLFVVYRDGWMEGSRVVVAGAKKPVKCPNDAQGIENQ